MVFCWLGESVVGLLSAILLVALGDTLRSGADQALLYRSCLALEREADFQKNRVPIAKPAARRPRRVHPGGRRHCREWGFAAGWMAEAAVSVVGVAIAWAMRGTSARRR
jgi:hypothetical protein